MPVGRGHLGRTPCFGGRADPLEQWISLVLTQLLEPKHLLFRCNGSLFGFSVSGHVYTVEGGYVGSFRDALQRGVDAELFSAGGDYLGEREPDHPDRLAVNTSKRRLHRRWLAELPALPSTAVTLYALRDEIALRDGWQDFPDSGGGERSGWACGHNSPPGAKCYRWG